MRSHAHFRPAPPWSRMMQAVRWAGRGLSEDIPGIFNAALRHHQAGRPVEAGQLFQAILAAEPEHAGSKYYLGLIAYQGGRYDQAVESLGQAILIEEGNSTYHYVLGKALRAQGRAADAIAHFERAAVLNPDDADTHSSLGMAL